MPFLPPLPPRPPINLWIWNVTLRWDWLVDSIGVLYAAHEAELALLGNIHQAMERLMTQGENLTAAVAELKANVTTLADEISSEIADLAAAIANQGGTTDPAVDAAIADLQATNARLSELSSSLSADDKSTP